MKRTARAGFLALPALSVSLYADAGAGYVSADVALPSFVRVVTVVD